MRHLLATSTMVALLVTSGSAVGAQEASPDPGASPTPEQLAEAEERLATATCMGKPATIVAIAGFETRGTSGADVIVGTEGDDVIRGEGGNDRICAGPGADVVEGGDGKDRIDGGVGDDQLDGGAGNDTVNGGTGADMVLGAAGNDRLSGAAGDDTLDGGKGNDVCVGGKGNDWLPGCNDKRGTKGKLVIRRNTTLKGPHRGEIVIEANKVTLDCAGHTVKGPGGRLGIQLANGTTGITVKNCDVTNFKDGFYLEDTRRNTLTNNRVYGNGEAGIYMSGSNQNKLTHNVFYDNAVGAGSLSGFFMADSDRNVVKHNSSSGSYEGNFSLSGTGNRVSHNVASGGDKGYQLNGARNTFHANHATGARITGWESEEEKSVFTANSATDGGVGFYMGGFGNTFTGNAANDNDQFGFEDFSAPGANTYEDNTCLRNRAGASSPAGLCDSSVPAEPEPSPPPAPGRVEVPELGIAVTFPDDWYVEYEGPSQLAAEPEMLGTIHSLPAGLLGSDDIAWYVAYGRPDLPGECAVQLYETSELTLDAFVDFYSGYDPSMGGTPYELTDVVRRDDLPAGEAVGLVGNVTLPFADENTPKPAVVQYAVDGGDVIAVVRCGGEPPADDWLSVVESLAETIELLPREGDDTEPEP